MNHDADHALRQKALRCAFAASVLILSLVSGLLPLAPRSAHAQAAGGYAENFDDGAAQGWDLNWWSGGGKWVVNNGRLVGRGAAWAVCANCYQPWVPYILSFELATLQGSLHVNVHISENDRLGIGFHYPGGDELAVYVIRGEGKTPRASVEIPFNLSAYLDETGGEGITIAIVVEEGYTEVHLQGAEKDPVLAYEDPEPPPHGAFGFETLAGSYVEIDNFWIKQTDTEPRPWFLEGYVYDGQVGDESYPLYGVTVEAFGSNRPWPTLGEPLASTTTDRDGWYGFEVPPGYEYYAIRAFPSPGYVPAGARSIHGSVRAEDWIEHQSPMPDSLRGGDQFWVQPPGGPDLVILLADRWHLENEGQDLVFEVEIENQGNTPAPGTIVWVGDLTRDWGGLGELPGLAPGEVAVGAVRLAIADDVRGARHRFVVEVDPDNRILELNEENNRVETPSVEIPPLPTGEPPPTQPPPTEPLPTEPPSQPTPTPPSDRPRGDGRWLLVAGGVAALGGLGYAAWRMFKGRPEGPPTPVAPLVVPVRLMNIWLTEGTSGVGRRMADAEPLIDGNLYSLHLQVEGPREEGSAPAEAGPQAGTELSAVLFAPESDFEFERRVGMLRVPERGASNEIHHPFKPLRTGRNQLRACIYYGNVLLQSAYLEASVLAAGEREVAGEARLGTPATARLIDYVASVDLAGLDELPQPDLSLFTNQAPDGTHWIGVYSSDGETGLGLASGDVITLDSGTLNKLANKARQVLGEIEGLQEGRRSSYIYREAFHKLSDERRVWREDRLIRLACQGWDLFTNLLIAGGVPPMRQRNLWEKLKRPGLISLARCRGEGPSLPWAALYEQHLDTSREAEMRVCDVFKDWLADVNRPPDAENPAGIADLLADFQICRERNDCPLDGPAPKLTVCPFGFWGFLHQVEQPLQDVHPLPAGARDQVPEELGEARRNQTSRLECESSEPLEMLMAVWPGFGDVEEHRREIAQMFTDRGLPEPIYKDDRAEVLPLLQQGGKHLYYFFCHGDGEGAQFGLKLGPMANPGYIRAGNLSPLIANWPEAPQPLIILNGCETVALLAERIHLFTEALRSLGACGVVGTEIKVLTGLARPFGTSVLRSFLHGDSLGEAFLTARRDLLRECNPLGLAYTFYAPATLHLHEEKGCAWCRKHGLAAD